MAPPTAAARAHCWTLHQSTLSILRKAESSGASSARAASRSLGPAGGPEGPGPGATPSPSPRSPVGPTTRGARSIPPARAQGTEGRAARGGRGVGQQPRPAARSARRPGLRRRAPCPSMAHVPRRVTMRGNARGNARRRHRAPSFGSRSQRNQFRAIAPAEPKRAAPVGPTWAALFSFS